MDALALTGGEANLRGHPVDQLGVAVDQPVQVVGDAAAATHHLLYQFTLRTKKKNGKKEYNSPIFCSHKQKFSSRFESVKLESVEPFRHFEAEPRPRPTSRKFRKSSQS